MVKTDTRQIIRNYLAGKIIPVSLEEIAEAIDCYTTIVKSVLTDLINSKEVELVKQGKKHFYCLRRD